MSPQDLTKIQPDFMVISFYKLFGLPTGLGALLVHSSATGLSIAAVKCQDLVLTNWDNGRTTITTMTTMTDKCLSRGWMTWRHQPNYYTHPDVTTPHYTTLHILDITTPHCIELHYTTHTTLHTPYITTSLHYTSLHTPDITTHHLTIPLLTIQNY